MCTCVRRCPRARGRGLDSRDVVWSLQRLAAGAGLALLSPFGKPTRDPHDPLAVLVPGAAPDALGAGAFEPGHCAAATRIFALRTRRNRSIPRNDRAQATTSRGTSTQLAAQRSSNHLRSPRAGPRGSPSLVRSWRSGCGMAGARAPSTARRRRGLRRGTLRMGGAQDGTRRRPLGRSGRGAGASGRDTRVPPRLSRTARPASPRGDYGWGGASADLLVRDDAPHLVEIARALAALLSRPGHEVRARPEAWAPLRRRRRSHRFELMLDFVRPIGPPGPATLSALLTAADAALARHPPRLGVFDARRIARTLAMGVVGELADRGRPRSRRPRAGELEPRRGLAPG